MTLISHTEKSEAKAPQWAVTLPKKMPEDVYGGMTEAGERTPGLYELMLAHPDKMGEINDRVLAQLGDERGMRLYEDAEREAHHTMQIDALRIDLYEAIHAARQAGLKAEATIARLEGDDVYDVELAESADVVYLKAFVADIRKAGAAAYRFLPFDENGDLK